MGIFLATAGHSYLNEITGNVIFIIFYKPSYDLPFRVASAFPGIYYLYLPLRRLHYQNLNLLEILYQYETLPYSPC